MNSRWAWFLCLMLWLAATPAMSLEFKLDNGYLIKLKESCGGKSWHLILKDSENEYEGKNIFALGPGGKEKLLGGTEWVRSLVWSPDCHKVAVNRHVTSD